MVTMLFRQQQAGSVVVAAGDMTMNVHRPGHDDLAGQALNSVEFSIRTGIICHQSILDKQVVLFAMQILCGIEKL